MKKIPAFNPKPRKAVKKREREALLKKRFDFWTRVGKSRWLETQEPMISEEAEKTEESRTLDRIIDRKKTRSWIYFRTSLKEIQEGLGFDINAEIRKRINATNEKKPVKVLDLGCGDGTALREIKGKFESKVRTVGLVLKKSPGEQYAGIDRLITGSLQEIKPMESFDIIYSHFGATFHTKLKLTALEKIASWLKPGGIAVIDLRRLGEEYQENPLQKIKTLLMQNGMTNIQVEPLGNWVAGFTKPVRKLP